MDNQNQQQQVNKNTGNLQDHKPAETVEEFLQFLEPAMKVHLMSEGQVNDNVEQVLPRHESDFQSPPPSSPMLHSEGFEDSESDYSQGWIGGEGVAPYSPTLPWLQDLSFESVRDFLTKYSRYERGIVHGLLEEPPVIISMKELICDNVLNQITKEYWENEPLRPLPPDVLTRMTEEYWKGQPLRPLPQKKLLDALQRINDVANVVDAILPAKDVVGDEKVASPPQAMYCKEGGEPTLRNEGYARRAKREKAEQRALRVGMLRLPYDRIIRPFHPYQKKGAV